MISAQQVVQDLQLYLYKEVEQSYGDAIAFSCAQALLDCLYLNFKHQLMYIPTYDSSNLSVIYESIYQEFNGKNHMELAIKYKRSLQNIYSIIKKLRAIKIRSIQTDIFPLAEEEKIIIPQTFLVIEEYLPHDFLKCGLSPKYSLELSKKISVFLSGNYPGISICISDKLVKKQAEKSQQNLFSNAESHFQI